MSAAECVSMACSLGVTLAADGGRVKLSGLDKLTRGQAETLLAVVKANRDTLLAMLTPCSHCGGLDFWTNGAGAVLCGGCVPPPSPEECLAELEELVRQHAGRLFRVQFEPDCCWLSYSGWPDAYVAAVFKGCEAMLDADAGLRASLRRLQTESLERRKRSGGGRR